jgi:hypothetical protein
MPFSFMEVESISGSYLLSAEDPASSFLSTARLIVLINLNTEEVLDITRASDKNPTSQAYPISSITRWAYFGFASMTLFNTFAFSISIVPEGKAFS